MKLYNVFLAAMLLLAVFIFGCEPDDPPIPYNPLNGRTNAVFNSDKKYGTVSDIDGNVYKTIQIGEQTWMAENLRTTKYNNGDELPNVKDTTEWANLYSGAYCNYNNTNSLDTIATYGRLYNYFAVADERRLAPKGWRVANVVDWLILVEYLGGDSIAGNHLKEVGTLHWEDPYQSDNSCGFTALPEGFRRSGENSVSIGFYSFWWATMDNVGDQAPFLKLFYFDSYVWRNFYYVNSGFAVRCIKEN